MLLEMQGDEPSSLSATMEIKELDPIPPMTAEQAETRANNQPMVSRDWALHRIHECIVGSPCRWCPALNLGLHAIKLMAGKRRGEEEGMSGLSVLILGVPRSSGHFLHTL
jgi:hypothetical protein